jgi:hypothetical protein
MRGCNDGCSARGGFNGKPIGKTYLPNDLKKQCKFCLIIVGEKLFNKSPAAEYLSCAYYTNVSLVGVKTTKFSV